MPNTRETSAANWFLQAQRCFTERHQGCPRCTVQHCVFRSQWGTRVEYYCTACDFSVCHDQEADLYLMEEGDGAPLAAALLSENEPTEK